MILRDDAAAYLKKKFLPPLIKKEGMQITNLVT